jgi:hypothetical protein
MVNIVQATRRTHCANSRSWRTSASPHGRVSRRLVSDEQDLFTRTYLASARERRGCQTSLAPGNRVARFGPIRGCDRCLTRVVAGGDTPSISGGGYGTPSVVQAESNAARGDSRSPGATPGVESGPAAPQGVDPVPATPSATLAALAGRIRSRACCKALIVAIWPGRSHPVPRADPGCVLVGGGSRGSRTIPRCDHSGPRVKRADCH